MSSSRSIGPAVKRYVALIVVLGAVALVLSARADSSLAVSSASDALGIAFFLAVGMGLELAQHRLALGSATGSIAFVVYLAAAPVFGPTICAAIAGCSLAAAELLIGKQAIKIVFNVAQHIVALTAGGAVYGLAGGTVPPSSLDQAVIPFLGLVFTYFVINSGAVSGVIALGEGRPFAEVWLRNTWSLATYDLIASAFALGIAWVYLRWGVTGVSAVVIPILFLRHTYLVNLQLQATNRELLELMVKAIEARDPYTSGHSQRVSGIARILAREMGLHLRETDNIATAALMHDVGKIYEEFAPILRKDGKLTPEEKQVMHSHPVRSAELVGTISNLRGYVEKCVRHHHENFDGSGYPDGLAVDSIPLGARLILVADTTDAMTTDRPYRKALSYDRVVQELEKYAGRQFDPRVVTAFKRSAAIRQLVREDRPRSEPLPVLELERAAQLAVR